jgi:hypothetical protein
VSAYTHVLACGALPSGKSLTITTLRPEGLRRCTPDLSRSLLCLERSPRVAGAGAGWMNCSHPRSARSWVIVRRRFDAAFGATQLVETHPASNTPKTTTGVHGSRFTFPLLSRLFVDLHGRPWTYWRKAWDSNPRRPRRPQQFSRLSHSSALAAFHCQG